MRDGRPDDEEWFKCLSEAISFLKLTLALDVLTCEIIEEQLDDNGKERVRKFKEVLGDKVLKYLVGVEANMSISGALPEKVIVMDIKHRDSEFERLMSMSRNEIEQKAEAYARGK